mgnify:CR=1 FL=1
MLNFIKSLFKQEETNNFYNDRQYFFENLEQQNKFKTLITRENMFDIKGKKMLDSNIMMRLSDKEKIDYVLQSVTTYYKILESLNSNLPEYKRY